MSEREYSLGLLRDLVDQCQRYDHEIHLLYEAHLKEVHALHTHIHALNGIQVQVNNLTNENNKLIDAIERLREDKNRSEKMHSDNLSILKERCSQLESEKSEALAISHEHASNVNNLLNSRSWKITAPLRKTSYLIGKVTPVKSAKQITKKGIAKSGLYFKDKPKARAIILSNLEYTPWLRDRLMNIMAAELLAQNSSSEDEWAEQLNFESLTPMGQRYYKLLVKN